jgi:alkylation response protein AidB-like acyl-CoA dehydrogenase
MDFELSETEEILVKDVRKFIESEVTPIIDEYEERGELPPLTLIRKMKPFGYIGGVLPEEEGGHGMSYVLYGILSEELGGAWASLGIMIVSLNVALLSIFHFGTEQQKKKFIPLLLSGEKIVFNAMTEPNVGSDLGNMETSAVLNGDYYIINGTKTLITSGSVADLGILFTSTDKAKGPQGISSFIVEKGLTNYSTNDIKKMGLRSSRLSEIFLSDSRIPRENLLGQEGEGLKIALRLLNQSRFLVACRFVGTAQAAIDASIKYAKVRNQFGRPVGGFQLVQKLIADMIVETEAARLLTYKVGSLMDKGRKCNREASIAKLFSSQIAQNAVAKAIQIHGGYGYTEDHPLVRYCRDIKPATIAEGTSEIQTLIIGRDVLGISSLD